MSQFLKTQRSQESFIPGGLGDSANLSVSSHSDFEGKKNKKTLRFHSCSTSAHLLTHLLKEERQQQEMITLYESVLRYGRISLLPVNRAHTSVSRADTSARQRLHRRLRVDPERWMEMYQPRINTHNTQQLPLHQSNRCSRPNPDFCLSHGALCFHDLFIYTLIHILVLSGCGNGMCSLGSPCVPACVGGKVSLKEISSSSVMLTMGLRDLHCKPGA